MLSPAAEVAPKTALASAKSLTTKSSENAVGCQSRVRWRGSRDARRRSQPEPLSTPATMPSTSRAAARRDTSGLVAAETAQGEGFEWGQLTVRPHHVVIGDGDRSGT